MKNVVLKTAEVDTPLGPMVAIADETALYLLEFNDRRGLELEKERLKHWTSAVIVPGVTPTITAIEQELKDYFAGTLHTFNTPIILYGTPFQKQVWNALRTVSFGKTISYKEQATIINKPSACRAVANANGANQIAIVVPCHRIITSLGTLGGYGAGVNRKKWLIEHEAGYS